MNIIPNSIQQYAKMFFQKLLQLQGKKTKQKTKQSLHAKLLQINDFKNEDRSRLESSPLTTIQEHSLETRNHYHFWLMSTAASFGLFQADFRLVSSRKQNQFYVLLSLLCCILGIPPLPALCLCLLHCTCALSLVGCLPKQDNQVCARQETTGSSTGIPGVGNAPTGSGSQEQGMPCSPSLPCTQLALVSMLNLVPGFSCHISLYANTHHQRYCRKARGVD